MKRLILKEAEDKEVLKLVDKADKVGKTLEKEFKAIEKAMEGLKPHSKIFLLNEVVSRVVAYAQLPPFINTSILIYLEWMGT